MAAVNKVKDYTPKQISNAERLIQVLMGVPEEQQALFTAVATAYIDGVEAGMRIAQEIEGVAYEARQTVTLWQAGWLASCKHSRANKKKEEIGMKYPDNWEQMTMEEKEEWAYLNSTPEGRFSTRTKEAGERLVRRILEDEELSEIRIAELRKVFDRAEKQLKIIYGQTTLRQATSAFEGLPKEGCSYPRTGFPE